MSPLLRLSLFLKCASAHQVGLAHQVCFRLQVANKVYGERTRTRRLSFLFVVQVFPTLYLPVMTEANQRVLRPYRMYLPVLPAWWAFRSRMAKLNEFLINYFRCI
jgi:hypothetical protein